MRTLCTQNNKHSPISQLLFLSCLSNWTHARAPVSKNRLVYQRPPLSTNRISAMMMAGSSNPHLISANVAVVQSELCFIDLFQGRGKITSGLLPVRNNNGVLLLLFVVCVFFLFFFGLTSVLEHGGIFTADSNCWCKRVKRRIHVCVWKHRIKVIVL